MGQTHRVKTKKPNELGLYDMCGNVAEMVDNMNTEAYELKLGRRDYERNLRHLFRGGSWKSKARHCTIVNEFTFVPYSEMGFRLALSIDNQQ